MLDREDLQAIRQMMDELMDQKLDAQKKEIMHEVSVLMDSEFTPKFNLLAEGQQQIIDKLGRLEARIDTDEEKLYDHEEMLREHEEKLKAIS